MKPARIIIIVVSLMWGGLLNADTIFLQSAQESIRGVKIVSFKDGAVESLDKQGNRSTIKYDDIAIIRVDGQVDLNAAEKFLSIRQYDQAIHSYRKSLAGEARKISWIDLWINARLMNIYARQGRIDESTKIYIDLAGRISPWVASVAPKQNEIKAQPDLLERAAAMLVKARDDSSSTAVREALAKFYDRLGCKKELPDVRPVQSAVVDEKDFETFDQPGPWLDTWAKKKIESDDSAAVLRVTQRLYKTSLRRNLPAVFYWRGRAELSAKDFDHAALSFLRVAIEFPASAYVPEAFFYAAHSAEQAGRSDYARKLRMELIDTFNNSNDYRVIPLVEQARELLNDKE